MRRFLPKFAVLLLTSILPWCAACDDERRHGALLGADVAPATVTIAADAPPADVARALLEALRDVQTARIGGLGSPEKKTNYKAALGRVWSLTAQDRVHDSIRKFGASDKGGYVPQNISREAAVTLATESWASIIAHYVDGLDFSTLQMIPNPPRPNSPLVITLEAENPADREKLSAVEALPRFAAVKDAQANPIIPAGPADQHLLRRECLKQGFNIPIRVLIEIKLEPVAGSWRATSLKIDPTSLSRPRTPSPTSLPS